MPTAGGLSSVGMRGIAMPVAIVLADTSSLLDSARVAMGVDLVEPQARGIHMSRLYLLADTWLTHDPVSPDALRQLVQESVASQSGLSRGGFVRIRGGLTRRRLALKSENSGYRRYDVELSVRCDGNGTSWLEEAVRVEYSSTSPCSAALARQLTRQRFERDFGEDAMPSRQRVAEWLESERGMPATPHSQRSAADLRVRRSLAAVEERNFFELDHWIDRCEDALGTPVQAAVKREDEQEFAFRNGQNLMFCEDAARRVQRELVRASHLLGYRVQVAHFESLHAHDAMAVATGGQLEDRGGEFDLPPA